MDGPEQEVVVQQSSSDGKSVQELEMESSRAASGRASEFERSCFSPRQEASSVFSHEETPVFAPSTGPSPRPGHQVNLKRARMKGARNWLFLRHQTTQKHVGYGSALWVSWHFTCAFPQRVARTLVGQERAPTETSRPPGPDPCGHLHSFGAARPWLRLSLGLARPHIHPAVTVGGSYWHLVLCALHVFLVVGQ